MQLPLELIQTVIEAFWHMPLTAADRTTFLASSTLVNSTWADTVDQVSARHVYLTSPLLAEHFLQCAQASARPPLPQIAPSLLGRLFSGRTKRPESRRLPTRPANLACVAITVEITNTATHPKPPKYLPQLPMGFVLDELLEHVDAHSLLPNLRTLAIEYIDAPFENVFQRYGLAALPNHVRELAVRWRYSEGMPDWLAKSLREKQGPQCHFNWVAEGVRRVVVEGAGDNVVKGLKCACPAAKVEAVR